MMSGVMSESNISYMWEFSHLALTGMLVAYSFNEESNIF
jgi:hypothetical protein